MSSPSGLQIAETSDSRGLPLFVCVLKHNAVSLRPSHRRVKELRKAFTPNECARIIKLAEAHPTGWQSSRHSHYATTDIPVEELMEGQRENFIDSIVDDVVLPEISAFFGLNREFLHVTDLFVVKYQFVEGKQAGLAPHVDGQPWSFVITLNDPSLFEGGGTLFIADNVTCRPALGSALVFSGKNLHSGVNITSGVRYILTGFCDYVPDFGNEDGAEHVGFMRSYEPLHDGYAARDGIRTGDVVRGAYSNDGELHMVGGVTVGEEGEEMDDEMKQLMSRFVKETSQDEAGSKDKKGAVFSLLVERMIDSTNYEEDEQVVVGGKEESSHHERSEKELEDDAARKRTADLDNTDDRALLDLIHNSYQFLSVGQYFKWDRQ